MKILETKPNLDSFSNFAVVTAWAQDFCYVMNNRPWIFQLLFRIAVGRYGWREFAGMLGALIEGGHFVTNIDYSLQEQEYHQETVEIWGLK